MPKGETVKASQIASGDSIWFPNSRHPQVVNEVLIGHLANDDVVELRSDDAQWLVPQDYPLQRVVVEEAPQEASDGE